MPAHGGSDELVAFMDREVAGALPAPGFTRVVLDRSSARIVGERVLEAFTPYRAAGVARAMERTADVVLFPQQSIFPLHVRAPSVVTVHDLQHLFLPENFGLFDTHFRARVYPRSLRLATRIIAISDATRRDLIARCGVDGQRIDVVPHGF